MAEDKPQNEGVLAELTIIEQVILGKALKRVETDIFHAVLKRFSYYLITAIGILTLAGIVNFYTLSERIESSVVQKMTSDSELRQRISTEILMLEKENARAASGFINDLNEINQMIRQIKDDLSKELQPKNSLSNKKNKSK